MNIDFNPTPRQDEFFEAFHDPSKRELLYGGSAGGGKSYVLWVIMLLKCFEHPEIRIGLARNTLVDIKRNTMVTFWEIVNNWKIPKSMFTYNSIEGYIKWWNGSIIQFYELRYLPSDPNYDRFGGALLTFGCIEEAAGVELKGKDIFKTRLGRWRNKEFGINNKLLMTCNPGSNFIYTEFYLPWSKGELDPYKTFVRAKLSDNPHLGEDYREALASLPPADRSRLLEGEWDFDTDKARLLKYDEVNAMYEVHPDYDPEGKLYLSADIAFQSDKCIFILWQGLTIIEIINYEGDEPDKELLRLRDKHAVSPSRIVYDADGVGQFLKGKLRGAIAFKNNGQPLKKENYENLKTQVYFKLADKIREGEVKIKTNNLKDDLMQEVYEIKSQPLETIDGKLKLVKKKDVARIIGRSPDISDAMAYRMYFELKEYRKPF